MTEREVRRVRLFAEAARLTDFGTRVTLARAQRELGQRRVDVDLLDVEVLGPDSVVVSLHLRPALRTDDVVDDLRSVLDLGPGDHEPWHGPGVVRGVGGWPGPDRRDVVGGPSPRPACPGCGSEDGTHRPGCTYRRRGTSR